VRAQMAHIDELRAKYDALVEAVQKEYGAHGTLIITYADPQTGFRADQSRCRCTTVREAEG
jgi:hypothetical protein